LTAAEPLMSQRGSGAFLFLEPTSGFIPGNDYPQERIDMFIAMNRFQVKVGSEKAFETVWATRESYLGSMAGFVEFHLLKGPVADDHTLYSSHTTWSTRRPSKPGPGRKSSAAPMPAPTTRPAKACNLGHPKFEGFEVIQSERKSSAAA